MKRVFVLFCVFCLIFIVSLAEEDGFYNEDGSYTSYRSEDGISSLTTTENDGSMSGIYYDEESGSYMEWDVDAEGNVTTTIYNSDGSKSGYSSDVGGGITQWDTDTQGNTSSTTKNPDGTTYGYYSEDGGPITQWDTDTQGNTSSTTYNNDGSSSGYYSVAGGSMYEWYNDPEGNALLNTYNTDGTVNSAIMDVDGNYIEWSTSGDGSVYGLNSYYGNTYYDNNSNTGKKYSNNYSGVTNASGTAYISTSGGWLNVRSYPSKDASVIAKLENGTQVTVTGISGEWTRIYTGSYDGYVLSRYLSGVRPMPTATPTPIPAATVAPPVYPQNVVRSTTEQFLAMRKLYPVQVTVHPVRISGFVLLRWAPSESEPVISYLYEGYTLTALATNNEWVQVLDPQTNDVGFIMRSQITGL